MSLRTERRELLPKSHAIQSSSASGITLNRELGSRQPVFLEARTTGFVQQLRHRTCIDLSLPNTIGLINPQVSSFDYDRITGGLLLGLQDAKGAGSMVSMLPNTARAWKPSHVSPRQTMRPMTAFRSQISSVNMSPSRTVVTTSTGSDYSPIIHITKLLDPSEINWPLPADSGMSFQFRPPDIITVWTSAPNPWISSDSTESIAIGTSNGVVNIYGQSNWHTQQALRTDSDVLALGWLGPHTLAAGLRDSNVHLWDSRSNGKVLRLRHGGPVVGIKPGDVETQPVVCGCRNSLCLYDLRMPSIKAGKLPSYTEGWSKRWRPNSATPTKPLIEFEYENNYHFQMGFNVQPDLGIVVAGDEHCGLQTWSLRTGRKIKGWLQGKDDRRLNRSLMKCIRIVEDEQGRPKIFAGSGFNIEEFGW